MNNFEILAILGALAWTYPLAIWIQKLLTKTKVEILNHKQLEIGFTTNGPIVNIDLAFSATNKDAFIKKVAIELTHESNEKIELLWEWFEEELLEMDIPESGTVPYRKNQKAIALKVPIETLIEKKVGFHSPSFKSDYSKLFSSVNQKQINIISNDQDIAQLKTSDDYNNFIDTFKKHFPWKMGRYTGTISVEVSQRTKLFQQNFSFELTALDIKNMEQNIATCQKLVELHFVAPDPDFTTSWKWANPFDMDK